MKAPTVLVKVYVRFLIILFEQIANRTHARILPYLFDLCNLYVPAWLTLYSLWQTCVDG